jgi:hypothetical protein
MSASLRRRTVGRIDESARDAVVTLAATIASFLTTFWLAKQLHVDAVSLGVAAAVLALSLGRKPASHAGRFEWIALPLVGLVASAIGHLLLAVPLVGSAIFTLGVGLSVWLRAFGERARRIGALLALPLIVILVVPIPRVSGSPVLSLACALGVGVLALAWVRLLQALARRLRFVRATDDEFADGEDATERAPRANAATASSATVRRRLSVPARQALQMLVALALAFVFGRVLFPNHWSWVVLTAFIVCSGNHGRGDVLHKSVLRVIGAIAGTVGAVAVLALPHIDGPLEALVIFAALFVGLWLRARNYAYWAGCITLVLALLQGAAPLASALALAERLEGIVLGAVCGIAASWFVLPIRTRDVVFKRLSSALLALEETFAADADERAERLRVVDACVARLDRIAPPLEWHFRLRRASPGDEHPAAWISAMRRCAMYARDFDGDRRAVVGRVRLARRALGQRVRPATVGEGVSADDLSGALEALRATLARESKTT